MELEFSGLPGPWSQHLMLIKPQVDELALWMLTVQTQGATAAAGIPAMRGADSTTDRVAGTRRWRGLSGSGPQSSCLFPTHTCMCMCMPSFSLSVSLSLSLTHTHTHIHTSPGSQARRSLVLVSFQLLTSCVTLGNPNSLDFSFHNRGWIRGFQRLLRFGPILSRRF